MSTQPSHQPYGTVGAPDPAEPPLAPGFQRCPCGRPVRPWFRGQGVGHAIWLGVVSPLLTLALYALVVGVAFAPGVRQVPGATAVVLGLLVVFYLVALIALAASAKHRGRCLAGRSLIWFLLWPGAAISAVASAV